MGTISGGSPGPICDWTFSEAFGALGGTVTFAPGSMTFNTANAIEFPGVTKPFPASFSSPLGISGQYSFSEYLNPPTALTTYQFYLTNFDMSEIAALGLFGDGSVVFQVGPPAAAPFYVGTWTPNNGTHEVHFSIDGAGVPVLFIDGVSIPLVFAGTGASAAGALPVNVVSFFVGDDAPPGSASFTNIFLTTGALGPETVFCCPT